MSKEHQLNVLLVDRDAASTAELKRILTTDGFQVEVLNEPDRAAEEIRSHGYQLVILDVSPSNQAGVRALEEIRLQDDDLCVIATTEVASVEMAISTMKKQAFHYLQKPVDEEEIRAVLEEAIKAKGLHVDQDTRLNVEVGRRIRERRHGCPLTLKQLANRTGLSVSLISQIELGKSAASVSTLRRVSTALGVRMGHFFETV
ncbi:MAG: two-component system response regulator [Deltaproteobacteria bacterium]|nr:two-component system response regulator [Deltaproteobacteria bacterium]